MNNIKNNHKYNIKAYGNTRISLRTETGLITDSHNKSILNNIRSKGISLNRVIGNKQPRRFMSSNQKYIVETLKEEIETEDKTVKSAIADANIDQPKVSYKDIYELENLKLGLKRIKNSVIPGLDKKLKKDITETQLIALQKTLRNQSYKPKPNKRISINKPNGGIRLLGIACTNDKIIQSTLLLLLEPILEKIFLDNSHGFRPKKGCHTALKEIKFK